MDINMVFVTATRKKYRYPTVKGDITTEQLWELPLKGKDNFDLNTTAKKVNSLLRESSEESFVETKLNPNQTMYENMLTIVKYVISVKQAEAEKAQRQVLARAEKEKLLAILAEKQTGKLSALTEEELIKRINSLNDDITA